MEKIKRIWSKIGNKSVNWNSKIVIIEKKFEDLILNVSSRAALSAKFLVGKKDKIAADKAAVDAMRSQLNKIDMNGEIVIGEGEL